MYPRFLLLVCLLLNGLMIYGQDRFIIISGIITDASTHKPIPSANIQLKNSSTGTISNNLGTFTFKIPERLVTDSVLISCIGYRSMTRLFTTTNQQVQVALTPAVISLPEVAIHVQSGLEILQKAIAAITRNYDTTDTRMTAFYREDIHFDNDTLNYNESVLDVFKTFRRDKEHRDQIRIIKGRKIPAPPNNDPQFYGWIGNITNTAYSSLGEDIIKYNNVKNSILAPHNFRYYNYTLAETIAEGERQLLVIRITPKKNSRKGIIKGAIYIDEATLAMVRFEVETTPAGNDYINKHGKGGLRYTIMSKVVGGSLDFTGIKMTISYQAFQGKYYLHTVLRHWDVVINSRKRNLNNIPWTGDFNFLVTGINKDSVRQFQTGVSSHQNSMNNLIGSNYDAAFWENYNILQPELPDTIKTTPAGAKVGGKVSNRQNGFTRADTLRGQLSPLRSYYDVTFYHLDVDVDIDRHFLKGNNKIRYKVQQSFDSMQIDLYANMQIDRILYKGQPLSYTREYDAVFVRFPEKQTTGNTGEITVYYEGSPQIPDKSIPMNGGVLWDKDEEGNPWVQVVCQGSGASLWWPCKDHLSDEPDSMCIWITVPNGLTEISNGRLLQKVPVGNTKTRFEWAVTYPINNYNATFCIGKYAHYTDLYVGGDSLTIDYYVMPYNLEAGKQIFAKVKQMLACYEKHFGPYAFRRDGFTLVESPYPMEHQSGVCIGKINRNQLPELPVLLWHEAAHEWWGNAISCKDIADMWMHEAFATYAESLVIEDLFDKQTASVFLNDQKNGVGNKEPVIGEYDVNHIFYDINDMYTKGSLMLHTFRNVLDNDTLWFGLLKGIQQHFRYQTLSSDSLISYICQFTKYDYSAFFRQYLQYTRLPRLAFSLKEQGNNLLVRYRWETDVPDFSMPVKVTTAKDQMRFIHPTGPWKTLALKNMKAEDFEVDEEHFLIDVDELDDGRTSFIE
ncbi:M1 family aminopeptidase [Chitinophaga pinensis]|uniref:Peptidase M1 membrane alanine aminopeptidase domain-containing protein n=1 Tax=Chitinophaga pinensis TaxID=79329 RepID=A0A5C6LXY6_9BACT|nr:M1 family aminopeptidase [Chitinophaga pinensis]TWW02275.1 hypothetical protein FEF09_00250 [Chitinophaga pinensis]